MYHPLRMPSTKSVLGELRKNLVKTDLSDILGEDLVRHRISDLVRYASDASPYRYIPDVIVQPKNIDHVAAIFRYCTRKGHHATFRARGTSLNGQSQGDDIPMRGSTGAAGKSRTTGPIRAWSAHSTAFSHC